MKDWIPQIVIGIIVTVVGTVIANEIVGRPRPAYAARHPFRPRR